MYGILQKYQQTHEIQRFVYHWYSHFHINPFQIVLSYPSAYQSLEFCLNKSILSPGLSDLGEMIWKHCKGRMAWEDCCIFVLHNACVKPQVREEHLIPTQRSSCPKRSFSLFSLASYCLNTINYILVWCRRNTLQWSAYTSS